MTFRFNDTLVDAVERGDGKAANEVERRLEQWFEKPSVTGLWVPGITEAARLQAFGLNGSGRFTADSQAFQAQSYTPVWAAATTNPTLGNGTLIGRYWQFGNRVVGRVDLTLGSTTTVGSGIYGFSVPVTAASTLQAAGYAILRDVSAGARYLFHAEMNTTTQLVLYRSAIEPATAMTAAAPVVPASTDTVNIWFEYQSV